MTKLIKECGFTGCGRKQRAAGLCSGHYAQKRRGVDLKELSVLSATHWMTDVERFNHYVDRSGDCHVWTGGTNGHGYGQFRVGAERQLAHRFAYEMSFGPIPERLLIRHRCDNPACVRPNHMILGTHKENSGDALERERVANGERASTCKLSDLQVSEIRAKHLAGGVTQATLAVEYSVSRCQIGRILRGVSRKANTYAAP